MHFELLAVANLSIMGVDENITIEAVTSMWTKGMSLQGK
jgi:hypothetical protein